MGWCTGNTLDLYLGVFSLNLAQDIGYPDRGFFTVIFSTSSKTWLLASKSLQIYIHYPLI
jgi:hypothetical protein